MKFGPDIHFANMINATNSGEPLTFHLALPAGQSFNLSSNLNVYLIDWHSKCYTDIGSQTVLLW